MPSRDTAAFEYGKYICEKCSTTLDRPSSEGKRGPLKFGACAKGHMLVKTPQSSWVVNFLRGAGITIVLALFTVVFDALPSMKTIAVFYHFLYFAWILAGIWLVIKGLKQSKKAPPVARLGSANLAQGLGVVSLWLLGVIVFFFGDFFGWLLSGRPQ